MPDAFISYSRRDSREFVERLSAALEERGKDTWVDLDDIPPATRWREALDEGVLGSGAIAGTEGIWGCDVCGLDLDGLERLAAQRITRELTDAERERYFE